MGLSFFKALNPVSTDSGIIYREAGNLPCQGKEMIDSAVAENIRAAWNSDLDYGLGLGATYDILIGNHYDIGLEGRLDCHGGAKGVLDYLIFPLIARKLIADSYLQDRVTFSVSNVLSWAIAIPLELTRFSAAVGLTLLLAPVVALVHLLKASLPANDMENIPVSPSHRN